MFAARASGIHFFKIPYSFCLKNTQNHSFKHSTIVSVFARFSDTNKIEMIIGGLLENVFNITVQDCGTDFITNTDLFCKLSL